MTDPAQQALLRQRAQRLQHAGKRNELRVRLKRLRQRGQRCVYRVFLRALPRGVRKPRGRGKLPTALRKVRLRIPVKRRALRQRRALERERKAKAVAAHIARDGRLHPPPGVLVVEVHGRDARQRNPLRLRIRRAFKHRRKARLRVREELRRRVGVTERGVALRQRAGRKDLLRPPAPRDTPPLGRQLRLRLASELLTPHLPHAIDAHRLDRRHLRRHVKVQRAPVRGDRLAPSRPRLLFQIVHRIRPRGGRERRRQQAQGQRGPDFSAVHRLIPPCVREHRPSLSCIRRAARKFLTGGAEIFSFSFPSAIMVASTPRRGEGRRAHGRTRMV